MGFKKRNTQILGAYKGSQKIDKVYLGKNLIFPYNVYESYKEKIIFEKLMNLSEDFSSQFIPLIKKDFIEEEPVKLPKTITLNNEVFKGVLTTLSGTDTEF